MIADDLEQEVVSACSLGDDVDTDIRGAQAMGMQAVWINRNGAELPADVEPDAELASLDGLVAVVERLLNPVH